MRKTKFILGAGLLAMLSLSACSADEPVNGGEENNTATGNVYVAVRINDASSFGSRGTAGTPNEYEDADTGEHEVSSADFYFYDENGIFVSQANVWSEKNNAETPAYPNVQFKSTNVVVLKDLKAQNYPKYVVTVLNKPAGFTVEPGSTMADMEKALSIASYDNGIRKEKESGETVGKFVMATTSFAGTCKYYFATELVEDNFTQSNPTTATLVPAEIYVERLACKVSLGFGDGAGVTSNTVDGKTTYTKKLTLTIAGEANNELGETNIGAQEIYIHLLDWSLNATSKNTRMVKTIDISWNATSLPAFKDWNRANDHRSYWGKSFNYNAANAIYPSGDADGYSDETNPVAGKYLWTAAWTPEGANGFPLNYLSYNEITGDKMGKALYCPENTNTMDVISATGKAGSAITSVLIKAKVTSDAAGNTPLSLILYRGVMYTQTHYLKYMLSRMNQERNLNYYICTNPDAGEGVAKEYEQITTDYVELADDGDGKVVIVPKDAFGTTDIYRYDSANNEYELLDASSKNNFKTKLAELNELSGYEAIAYLGGLMYYNIPIEHLGDKTEAAPTGKTNEAVYGVVRNHSYHITVNKIANLGHGVFDPDKKIITPDPTPGQNLWQVGATINILSWKIVNQGVDL